MDRFILGTAGHIDHGKTAFIKAITGIDTDRLKEEKLRGITIELGFAHLELPEDILIGIVDVPGHEKFVKTMVAGATGVDLVAMVIAADEGIMPQTREHLEICELLGIEHGIIVITKIDLVDEELLELAKEDIKESLRNSFLAAAPMVEVSSLTGHGLDQFKTILTETLTHITRRERGSIFRLPIDRVFSMKGFGTVITGTTISGSITTGEEVSIYPKGTITKIRGLQVKGADINKVSSGFRTAVNLQGINKNDISRGDVLATKDSMVQSHMLDISLSALRNSSQPLKNRSKVRFYTGTSEIMTRVILIDREELAPGETCLAQLRLDKPVTLLRSDRYVLRSCSPVRTIGGGEVLHPHPRKKKTGKGSDIEELNILASGELTDIIDKFIFSERFKGIRKNYISFLSNASEKHVNKAIQKLLSLKKILIYDKEKEEVIHSAYFIKAKHQIISTITDYHKKYPLKEGLSKEELRTKSFVSNNNRLFSFLIDQLVKSDEIIQHNDMIRLPTHKVILAEEQEKFCRILKEKYLEAGLQPPYFKEILSQYPFISNTDILDLLIGEKFLIKVKEDLYFSRDALDRLKEELVDFLRKHKEINPAQFKNLTGASRKYTIPLFEYFDRLQVTMRVGDNRILRKG